MQPEFLTFAEAMELHDDQIQRYGGEPGIRDSGLLQSALAMPQATFDGRFLHQDLFEMAAAYLFHIVQNHPFIDGNKRAGTVAALIFLELNDVTLNVTEDSLAEFVIEVANGNREKSAITEFLRKHSSSSI